MDAVNKVSLEDMDSVSKWRGVSGNWKTRRLF